MRKSKTLEECQTVADFIVLMSRTVQDRPPGEMGDQARKDHLAAETVISKHLAAALAHYGPVVWLGLAWFCQTPARHTHIHTMPVKSAAALPWTIQATEKQSP